MPVQAATGLLAEVFVRFLGRIWVAAFSAACCAVLVPVWGGWTGVRADGSGLVSGPAEGSPQASAAQRARASNAQPVGTGSVSGTVVQEITEQGLRKVLVTLTGQDQEQRRDYATSTDTLGQFRIEGVAPGEYEVSISRWGFVRANSRTERNRITVIAGRDLTGLQYKMQAAGVVSGKITEADGDPLPGVTVWARPVGKSGAPLDSSGRSSEDTGEQTTNDLGEYRIPNLRAGDYMVQAQMHGGPGPVPDPAEHGRQNNHAVYTLTYYPGTIEQRQAGMVRVTGGTTSIASFVLAVSRSYRVSGNVLVAGNPQNVQMFLVSQTGQTEAQQLGESGQFEFRNIMPGAYVAQIVDMSTVGADGPLETHSRIIGSPIVVSDADVTGLELQPEASGSVSGKVRTEEGEALDWVDLAVSLVRVVESEELPQMADLGALGGSTDLGDDGSFAIKDLAGGKYRVFVGGHSEKARDYYLKSVTASGAEAVDSGFVVNGPTNVDVVLSARSGSIEGTVMDRNGNGAAEVVVLSMPASGKLGRPDAYVTERTDTGGHFLMRGMTPGAYLLVGLAEFEREPGKGNSGFRELFAKYAEQGVRVDLDEGERKNVTVNLLEEK